MIHHVHILEMNGESYHLKHSKTRRQRQLAQELGITVDPDTGEILDPLRGPIGKEAPLRPFPIAQ